MRKLFRFLTKTRLRKALSITLSLLILATSIKFVFFQPKVARAADSLIKFDEGYGTTISDINSNISGTITNALWKQESYCVSGKCLYFDGSGDYIDFGDDADVDFAGSDSFTITGWFRTPDITSGTRVLVAKYNASTGTDGGYKVFMDSNGYLIFAIDSDNTGFPSDSASTSTTSFDDNRWHHFAAVKNGTTSITIYVDGVQYQTDSTITSSTLVNTDNFYIGIDGDGASNGFSGFIDEIKVYSSVRSSSQIYSDMAGETSSRGTAVKLSDNQKSFSHGLVGYWQFDETSGNAQDSSGNGITLTNNGTASYANGKFGNAPDMVPASSQYFSTTTTIPSIRTVSFWVYPDSTTNYYFSLTGSVYLTSSSGTLTATGFTDPQIFVNGVPSTTISSAKWSLVTVTTQAPVDASTFYIGRQGTNYMDGKIDDFRLYNRTLEQREIFDLFLAGPSAKAHWKMDENTGSVINDSSGNGNTSSSFSGNTSWTQGVIGSALSFDGNDDVVTISETTSTDLGSTNDSYTVSAWFKTSYDSSTSQTIIAKNDGTGAYPFSLYLDSNEYACFQISDGTNSPSVCGTTTLNDGKWHHILGKRDVLNDVIYLYVDTVPISSTTDTTTTSTANNDNISVGNSGTSYTANDFNGSIDNAKIYNYALWELQITDSTSSGHSISGSPVSTMAAYFKLDENLSGNGTIYDSSGYGINEDLVSSGGNPFTSNGKVNGAINCFAPTTFQMTSGYDSIFNLGTESFSFSLWVKSSSATNPSANESVIGVGLSSGSRGYVIFFDTSGRINFAIDDDTTYTPDDVITSTEDYYDAQWHNITAVKSTTQKISLYVDGRLTASKEPLTANGSLRPASDDFSFCYKTINGVNSRFTGYIDEIRYFTFEIFQPQVDVLYNLASTTTLGSVNSSGSPEWSKKSSYCPPGNSCSSPIMAYDFEENTGTTIYSSTPENAVSDGSTSGMSQSNWVPGKIGTALKFDGTDDYATTFDPPQLDGAVEVTVSAWVKFNSLSNLATIFARRQNSNNRLVMQAGSTLGGNNDINIVTNCNLCSTPNSSTAYTTGNILTTGTWQHLAFTYNPNGSTNDDKVKFYLNGVRQSLTHSATVPNSLNSNAISPTIGVETGPTAGTYANAIIDQVRYYNYVRTQSQIAWDYNKGMPYVWYKFDEGSGSTAYNSVPNADGSGTLGNDATITIGASGSNTTTTDAWTNGTTGKMNYSLDLDGTDDRAVTGSFSPLAQSGLSSTTVSWGGWFYPKSSAATKTLIEKASEVRLSTDSSGKPICDIYTGGAFTTNTASSTSSALSTNSWQHIICVYDGTNIKVYVNGILKDTWSQTGSITAASSALHIGQNSSSAQRFQGQVDEIKLWNYNLTQEQVRADLNQGSAVRFGPSSGHP